MRNTRADFSGQVAVHSRGDYRGIRSYPQASRVIPTARRPSARSVMSSPAQPDVPIWTTVQELLEADDRVTPQLQGFLSLAVPAGVMAATLYLEVPNDLTAAQINKRLRLPIMEALSHICLLYTSPSPRD